MKTIRLTSDISLIDLAPPIPGFRSEMLGTYVIRGDKVALIDVGPAVSLDNLFAGLAELKIDPQDVYYILSSHIHLDHSGGLGGALKRLPNARAIVHDKGIPHLINPQRLWEASQKSIGPLANQYLMPEPVSIERMWPAQEGMKIDLGNIQLEVLLTPGHASHHLAFLDRQNGRLFAGEAAGVHFQYAGIARPATPLPFDLRQTIASLNKMIAVNPAEIYYAHFGPASDAINKLQQCKEQLILWGKIIARHLEDNADWRTILKEIQENEQSEKRIYQLTPEHLQREYFFIEHDILGYQEYLKKVGAGVIEEVEKNL